MNWLARAPLRFRESLLLLLPLLRRYSASDHSHLVTIFVRYCTAFSEPDETSRSLKLPRRKLHRRLDAAPIDEFVYRLLANHIAPLLSPQPLSPTKEIEDARFVCSSLAHYDMGCGRFTP